MPHTYSNLLFHIIFSTKDRVGTIAAEIRADLHAYIGGVVRNLGGAAVMVGGTADHVHLLVRLPPDVTVSDCVRVVKANSSKWVHERWPERKLFAWQPGYGAFTVSASVEPDVVAYISNQEKHHSRMSFRDEFISFLKKQGIAVDERYLWS